MVSYYLFLACFSCLNLLIHFLPTSYAQQNLVCPASACGNIQNISYPFRLRGDPQNCGDPNYELECRNNTTLLHFFSQEYRVQSINYNNYTIRLADSVVGNDTCSFPQHSSPDSLLSYTDHYPYSSLSYRFEFLARYVVLLISCPYPVNSTFFIRTDHCFERNVDFNASSSSNGTRYTYVTVGSLNASDVGDMCRIDGIFLMSRLFRASDNISLQEIHGSLLYGFEFSWFNALCGANCRGFGTCRLEGDRAICIAPNTNICVLFTHTIECDSRLLRILSSIASVIPSAFIAIGLTTRIIIGLPFLLWILIYKLRRKHLSVFDVIEGFLQSNNNLAPIRYSYSEIKKMTKGFREKLGEGGYGSVYKGKLRSGQDVAVKVLTKPSANGQDFINEVATIGRIHHFNVVKLVGYSAERSKCALVYDFMPNGSLEKYIHNKERTKLLNWETKYEIAVGVARGIEYLHRGCDIQILHFDIKPHNILLDENFTPKISDFGLAKFYSTENNSVTLTAVRGTIGYVAPELINRSIGSVSYKADVYSFGMLLLELVGLKRDLVENVENSSQYFPHWIYNHFEKEKDVEIGNVDEIDIDDDDDGGARKITRKMGIVGLWCIRMSPDDRPSMSKVVEMLEGETESLEIPPRATHTVLQITWNEDETWTSTYSTDTVSLLCEDTSMDH